MFGKKMSPTHQCESTKPQRDRIIYGGGWKNLREEHVKIKAFVCLFSTILATSLAVEHYDEHGFIVFLPGALLLIASLLLFLVERATTVPGSKDGDYDLRKLYGGEFRGSKGDDTHSKADKWAEPSGELNGYPRHVSCGAGAAPRAAVSHLPEAKLSTPGTGRNVNNFSGGLD